LAIDSINHILFKATDHGLLNPIRGSTLVTCTSLYADDAAVFVAPVKYDITFLASILVDLGKVTGLSANFHKSLVAPIRCEDIDLDERSSNPSQQQDQPFRCDTWGPL
jgi:hypothetical protein